MKAVMYHYVREFNLEYPFFRFLDIKNFRKQLDYFEKKFGFVTYDEWQRYITDGVLPEKKGKIILTFDDAMSCHYDFVYPELLKRSLWGIFYVPGSPYANGKLLDVHRIHLLTGKFDGVELLNCLKNLISDDMIPDNKREEFREFTYTKQKNYTGVSEFKRILNYFISYDFREGLIDSIASYFDYNFFAENFYVSIDNLQEMAKNGMLIGSHTMTHPVMSKLDLNSQRDQIIDSFEFLNRIGVAEQKTYCHPYGGFHSFNDDTVQILDEQSILYSFNVDSREIIKNDIEASRQFLPRFDCNEFDFGKAS